MPNYIDRALKSKDKRYAAVLTKLGHKPSATEKPIVPAPPKEAVLTVKETDLIADTETVTETIIKPKREYKRRDMKAED